MQRLATLALCCLFGTAIAGHEEGKLVCEKGYDLVKDKCIMDITTPLLCKKKRVMDKDGKCWEEDYKYPKEFCEPGYFVRGTQKRRRRDCVSKEIIPYTITCPKGFTYSRDHKVCEMYMYSKVVMTPTTDCQKSKDPVECMKYNNQAICPAGHGWDKKKNKCFIIKKADAQQSCPPTYAVWGLKCRKADRAPVKHMCPPGYKIMEDGTYLCYHKQEDYKRECPTGFELDKDLSKCIHYSEKEPIHVAPKVVSGSKGSSH